MVIIHEIQCDGGVLPHKTTGTTDEEDILSSTFVDLVNISTRPQYLQASDDTSVLMRLVSVLLGYHIFFADKMAATATNGNVIVIENDGHFQSEMTKAGAKLVVVDFTASWYVINCLSLKRFHREACKILAEAETRMAGRNSTKIAMNDISTRKS